MALFNDRLAVVHADRAERAVLCLTSLAAVPTLLVCVSRRRHAHGAAFLGSMAASLAYHACHWEMGVGHEACHARRVVDVAGALLALAAVGALFVGFRAPAWAAAWAAAVAASLAAGIAALGVSLAMLPAAGAGAAAATLAMARAGRLRWRPGAVDARDLRRGGLLFVASLAAFFAPAVRPGLYPYAHSAWHLGASASSFVLMRAATLKKAA